MLPCCLGRVCPLQHKQACHLDLGLVERKGAWSQRAPWFLFADNKKREWVLPALSLYVFVVGKLSGSPSAAENSGCESLRDMSQNPSLQMAGWV